LPNMVRGRRFDTAGKKYFMPRPGTCNFDANLTRAAPKC